MKKYMLACILSLPFLLHAQEPTKIQEVGGTTRSLSSFGVTYRIGNTDAVWRLDGAAINISQQVRTVNNTTQNLDFGVSLGREWRKPIGDMFELRTGFDVGFSFNTFSTTLMINPTTTRAYGGNRYTPRLNGVFGFNFLFSEALVLGFEIQPFASYSILDQYDESVSDDLQFVSSSKEKREEINFGVSTNSVLLSLAYRFQRSK